MVLEVVYLSLNPQRRLGPPVGRFCRLTNSASYQLLAADSMSVTCWQLAPGDEVKHEATESPLRGSTTSQGSKPLGQLMNGDVLVVLRSKRPRMKRWPKS